MNKLIVPGEVSFWKSWNVPPIEIELPLAVHASRPIALALAALCGAFAALWITLVAVLAYGGIRVSVTLSSGEALLSGALVIFMFVLAVLKLLLAINWLRDAFRSGPTLVINPEGIQDRRGDCFIAWKNVSSASILRPVSDLVRESVKLSLRSPIMSRPNRYNLGFPIPPRGSSDQFLVRLSLLSMPAPTLAKVIVELVKLHDGEVKSQALL
jgi:hypothetical protein